MTKTADARKLAVKLVKEGIDYNTARTKIKENVPCSKTTAHQAYRWAETQLKAEREEIPTEAPTLEIVEEPEKTPEFLERPEKPLEEIEKPKIPVSPEAEEEQLDFIRDMFRGTHILFCSKEGLLGSKYGHSNEVCVQTSDQLYRWLRRRYTLEELEKWDTVLLAMAYGNLVGKPVLTWVKERRAKAEKEAEKKKSEKPEEK